MRRITRICLDLLIVALLLAAAYLFWTNRRAENARYARDRQYAEETEAANREVRAKGQAIYDALSGAVKASMPGIVFWGDESLVDNRDTSLPTQLSNRILDALLAPVFDGLTEKTGLRTFSRRLVPVVNMGASEEGIPEIMVRAGVREMVVGKDFYLPAEVIARDMELRDESGTMLMFAQQHYAGFGIVEVQGVEGAFYAGSDGYDATHPFMAFARSSAGAALEIPAGTPVHAQTQTRYRGCPTVLFFREHPEIGDAALLKCMEEIIACQTEYAAQYAVVCTTPEGSVLDEMLARTFGSYYIRNENTPEEMGVGALRALSQQVYDALDKQGAFDAVREAADEALCALDLMA